MRAKVPKPPAREATVQVALRVPISLLGRIDAHAERLRDQTGVPTISRTDAMLGLLGRALDAAEGDAKKR